ncbi:acetyl-CoA synthetase-like protein, partial [Mycena metata]
QPFAGIDTVYDVLQYVAKTHGTRDALGWRDIVDGAIHSYSPPSSLVFGRAVRWRASFFFFSFFSCFCGRRAGGSRAARSPARGLGCVFLLPPFVFLMLITFYSVNWQLLAHACGSISTTLGPAGLTHSLNEPSCAALFTNAKLPTLLAVLPNTPTVKYIIFNGEPKPKLLEQLAAVRGDIKVLSIEELRQRGKAATTVSCIMYTSGSTGAPRGVVITHANLVASVGAVYTLLGHHLTPDDAYLAYLPLAHILEYIVELCMLFVGMPTRFGRIKTLTDASVRHCDGDIKEFRPSVMAGVPTVWETIRKGIVGKVQAGGVLRSSVFKGAV